MAEGHYHGDATVVADTGTYSVIVGMYAAGVVVTLVLYVVCFRYSGTGLVFAGLLLSLCIMGINLAEAGRQLENGYEHDISESDTIARNSFYIGVMLFAIGSFTDCINKRDILYVMPVILLTVIFSGVFVMPTVLAHTADTRGVIVAKHFRAISSSIGSGFMLVGILLLLQRIVQAGGATVLRGGLVARALA